MAFKVACGSALAFLLLLAPAASSAAPSREEALAEDDACFTGDDCAVNALQLAAGSSLAMERDLEKELISKAEELKDPTPFLSYVAMKFRTTVENLNREKVLEAHRLLLTPFEVVANVKMNIQKPASDPIWKNLTAQVYAVASHFTPDTEEWIRYCNAKDFKAFLNKSCHDAGGGTLIGGVPIDGFFCGTTKQGIDWSPPPFNGAPLTDYCNAKQGDSYKPGDGLCSRFSDKYILMSIMNWVPKWFRDGRTANPPSFDCILGLSECDIYYCQNCPNRCQWGSA